MRKIEVIGTMVEKNGPAPLPFPGDIPNYPLRPWDPDDPDEEKYGMIFCHRSLPCHVHVVPVDELLVMSDNMKNHEHV
jgi:hypothetical protein